MTKPPAMPELPEPAHRGPTGTGAYFDSYTADQMRAYALAALQSAQPAEVSDAQATPEPSHGMIGMGAHALANELAQAVAQDDADPDGHDMSAGLFGPNVSAWLRKVSAEYLSKGPAKNHCRGITDPGCDYLSTCGAICNKCGKEHRGQGGDSSAIDWTLQT